MDEQGRDERERRQDEALLGRLDERTKNIEKRLDESNSRQAEATKRIEARLDAMADSIKTIPDMKTVRNAVFGFIGLILTLVITAWLTGNLKIG